MEFYQVANAKRALPLLILVVLAGGCLFQAKSIGATEWWNTPVLKYAENIGDNSNGFGPLFWNKDESDQYLFCTAGMHANDNGALYSIPALVAAANAGAVAPIVSGGPSTPLYGNSWTGGALSDDLGRILTGGGFSGTGFTANHGSLPFSAPWTQNTTVFQITSDAEVGIQSMDFSHDSTAVYSILWDSGTSKGKNKVRKWTVGSLTANGNGLTFASDFTTTPSTIASVNVYYIGGKDLVYYGAGEGTTGGSVYVYDPAAGTETTLISSGLPASDIMNIKIGGVGLGQMHLYVHHDSGAVYVYDLAADGKSVGALVASFSAAQMKTAMGGGHFYL